MNPSTFDFRRSAILHSAVFYWGLSDLPQQLHFVASGFAQPIASLALSSEQDQHFNGSGATFAEITVKPMLQSHGTTIQ